MRNNYYYYFAPARMVLFFGLSILAIFEVLCKDISNLPIGNVKSLDVYVEGSTLHILFADQDPETKTSLLRYQGSNDGAQSWSTPIRVDVGGAAPYARGRGTDFQIAAAGNNLVAVWMTKGSGFMGRGPLVTAFSDDGGQSWKPGTNPADDGTDGDHSFIDVTADPEGNFHVVWLDKRNGQNKGLFSSTSMDGGKTWSSNQTVDSAACDCCWNVVTSDRKGNLYTLYRDLNPRDMALAVFYSGGNSWKSIGRVGEFDWNFDGCPHVGGGIAVDNKHDVPQIHTLVWTGKEDRLGLYYIRTKKGQEDWMAPVSMGSKTAKVPDISINQKGHLAAVWDDFLEKETAIFVSISTDNGDHWSKPRRISLPGLDATHARIVSIEDEFYIFWTESKDGKTVWKHYSI